MRLLALTCACLAAATGVFARQATPRLPAAQLDVASPASRVTGEPGAMRATRAGCRPTAVVTPAIRQRLVDIAVQEWAFFGYAIVDQTIGESEDDPPPPPPGQGRSRGRGRPRVSPEEGARLAASIAGYWTTTPEGAWIIDRQNTAWRGEAGTAARWNSPWSAAFISWVMCEAGLGDDAVFTRAVAHHRYIDQAIRARDGASSRTAYVAFDGGEAAIAPGDLLCSGRRPAYRSLAERRRQMGQGASTHCDVVVQLDAERQRILAIGGNVRGTVGLKIIPAEWDAARRRLRPFRPDDTRIGDNPYRGVRPIFAHLKLRAPEIGADALSASATMRAAVCGDGRPVPAAAARLVTAPVPATC
jgi:hypothetical protein